MKHISHPCKTLLSRLAVEADKDSEGYPHINSLVKSGIIDANEAVLLMQRVHYAVQ